LLRLGLLGPQPLRHDLPGVPGAQGEVHRVAVHPSQGPSPARRQPVVAKEPMSTDFVALTSAFAVGLPDVKACLIVSRDGLALGSHPADEEARARSVWGRLAELGDVERGFAVVGDELWVFCRRGPYAALAIAGASARPGVVLDRLEQMALIAEED